MENYLSNTGKRHLSTADIILLVVAFVFIALTVIIIWSSITASSNSDGSNAAVGVLQIAFWLASSFTGFIGAIVLCIGLSVLSNIKRPGRSTLDDEMNRKKYYQKTNILGLIWLSVPCAAALLYAYGSSFARDYIFIEAILLVLVVFGLVNAIKYISWSRTAKNMTVRPNNPGQPNTN